MNEIIWLFKAYYFGTLRVLPIELIIFIADLLRIKPSFRLIKSIELTNESLEIIKRNKVFDINDTSFGYIDYHEHSEQIVHIIRDRVNVCRIDANVPKFIEIFKFNYYTNYDRGSNTSESYGNNLIIKRHNTIEILDLIEGKLINNPPCQFIHRHFCPSWLSICKLNDFVYYICRRNLIVNTITLTENRLIYTHSYKLSSVNCIQELNLIILSDQYGQLVIFNPDTRIVNNYIKCGNSAIISTESCKIDEKNYVIIYLTKDGFIGIIHSYIIDLNMIFSPPELIIPKYKGLNNMQIVNNKYVLVSYSSGIDIYDFNGKIIRSFNESNYSRYLKTINRLAILNNNMIYLCKIVE